MIGKIIGFLIFFGVGVLFVVLGALAWKKEKINLFHDYHVDKVSEENKQAFCKLAGIGLIVSGAGMILTAVILTITDSVYSLLGFAVGFAVGLAMMLTAIKKYNR